MARYFRNLVLISVIFSVFCSAEIKAETGSIRIIQPTNSSTSNNIVTTSTVKLTDASSSPVSSSKTASKSTAAESSSVTTTSSTDPTSPVSSLGIGANVQTASVQVEPFVGSAGLSIPIQVPPGRAGIQPNLAVTYDSSERQLGNAGVGWTLDLGSIQISTKNGVPKYDGTDIFTMEQAGAIQDLVADPNIAGLFHMEVEGAFANIKFYTTYWVLTDKKGVKYYYGNTSDSIQNDPANPTHIFRWALNRVEDLNGNYMTISYLDDNGQIYPQTISYTGNDMSSRILSPYAQVNISYVSASSPCISYISKFLVKTAQRIDHITVSVGSNVQSTYTFTYHQSANTRRDLLQSVQQTGSDGNTQLPPVTFTYNESMPQWQLASGWTIPSDFTLNMNGGGQDAGIKILDLDGDGYPDFLRVSYNNGFISYSYLNNKNNGWTLNNNWALPSSTQLPAGLTSSTDWGIRLADFNGDGLMDITQQFIQGSSPGYDKIQTFYMNNSNGWDTTSNFTMPTGVYFYTYIVYFRFILPAVAINTIPDNSGTGQTGVEIGDVNGDGFPDLVQSKFSIDGGSSNVQGVYTNQYPQGSETFSLDSSFSMPSSSYTDFTNGATLVDLTGDGLSDIIYRKGGVSHVFMNTGTGFVEDTSSGWNTYPQYGDFTNVSTQMVDVNGDGLPDMVITTDGDRSDATILLNTGSGWSLYQGKIGDFNFFDYGTQFLDANADGMQDYLTYETGSSPELYLNANKPVDLLTGVNNGIGASTSIQYDSDFHYQNTYMPYFLPVVKSMTTTVGLQSYTTNYNYAGGLWDKNYREFDGFQTVTVTDPQGNYVTTTYLQDHWLKGNASEVDTYDSKGNPYSKTTSQWQTQNIVTNNTSNQISKFIYVSRTDNYLYDGSSVATPKRTAQEFTYGENPQYGDVTQTINDGQVDPVVGTSIDSNKTTTNVSYVYNTNNWLLGLPKQTTIQDVNGNTISKTSYFYDEDTTGSAAPILGHLTTKINWLGSITQPDPKTIYSYDAYGNLQSTKDPNLNITMITYDNTVHMFPEKTTNALNQTITMAYYGIDTIPLNDGQGLQGLWGQERSKTDANNQIAYTTYDVFGRPSTTISPLDSVALPTEQKSYNIQPTYIAVTDTARVVNGSSTTINTVSYYDGLGRLIETKSLGPIAGQYIVSGQTVYDNRGLPITKYLPHFTSNDLNTMDSIDITVPSSQVTYDPMGRIITKTNPNGTYASIAYNQWTTTTTDENGHLQKSYVDAFGHLIQKEEYTGADGRSPNYPAAAYTLYATTSYGYDPKGNLISVTDAHNNVTSITYDNLNRKIAMNDPDMGKWQYGYDGNGNLIWQQDAKGQVISFIYDALNRLQNRTDAISGPIVNLPNITPKSATFNVNYNFDLLNQSYGIGRLGSVSYDNGTAGFIYDQIGREASSNKTIDGTTYNVTRQYDALNDLKQIQYPDGSQVVYVYNQAGQITGVADAGAVNNGEINSAALREQTSNDRLSWVDKALGVSNAYAAAAVKPSISKQPVNITVTAPAAATFIVTAKGNPAPSYSWRQANPGSSIFTAITGATSNSYTTPASSVSNSGSKYECVISNTSGSVTSKPVTLTVKPTPVAPSITIQPVSVIVGVPTKATFTLSASGTPAPSFQWMKSVNGGKFIKITGATSSSYTTAATALTNSGTQYECVVSNAAGNITSNAVILTVNPMSVTLTSPANNSVFLAGSNVTISATASENKGTISSVSFYNGTTLLGTTYNPYTYSWNNIQPGNYSLTAVAQDSKGKQTTSQAISLTVDTPIPAVSLTANPVTGIAPASVTLTASPLETGGTISKVDFYNGSSLLGTKTSSPYVFIWNNVTAGTYNLTAVTTDSYGTKATSPMVSININSHTAPTVNLTNPINGASYTAPTNVTMTAIASATDATISQVAFYNGATLLTTITSSPYTYTWNNPAPGIYNITAVATDSTGSVSVPSAINLTVIQPAPTVSLTSPSNNTSFTASSNITLTANATASYGSISQVEFFNGSTLIGTVTTSPYTFVWNNVAAGKYTLTAQAFNNGVQATSSPVNIIVNALPTVSLSANSSTYAAPAIVTLSATASEIGGTISKVEFYNGSTLLGSVTSPPYTYTWNNVPAGNYSLTAEAFDDNSNMTTSSAITIGVTTPNVYIKDINYNANGQITQIQYGNGTATAYTYDPLSFRLLRIYTSNAQAQVIQDLNYTYDSLGQVLTITDNVNTGTQIMTQSFAYDALNRLVSASGSYGNKTYGYDTIGNIILKDGLTYNYGDIHGRIDGTAAGPHAVTSLSDGTIFKYDDNGNMISLQKGSNLTQYAYDSQNRLQTVTVGGFTAATYTYDGDGGRIKKTVYRRDLALYNDNTNALLFENVPNPLPATAQNPTIDTTRYIGNVYEIENPSSDNAAQSRLTKFIYLGSTRIAAVGNDGNVFYYHTDHLGGTNVLTDGTGIERELTEYDPFGQVIVHEKYGNDSATIWYYFTGKPLDDETGLIFLGARYYNPVLGRFITPDTVVQDPGGTPQTLNRYTYCNNNPVNLVDPNGHSWWKKFWHSIEKTVRHIVNAIAPYIGIAGIFLQDAVSGNWSNFGRQMAVAGISAVATFLLPGVGELSSDLFLNVLGHAVIGAFEGAVIGGVSSVIMGGTFGQGAVSGAIGGAIGGALQGVTTSEQFHNWQNGNGFQSNAEIQANVMKQLEATGVPSIVFGNNTKINWNDMADAEQDDIEWEKMDELGDVHTTTLDALTEMQNQRVTQQQMQDFEFQQSMNMGGDMAAVKRFAIFTDESGNITSTYDITKGNPGFITKSGVNISIVTVCGGGNVNCSGQENLWQR